MLLTLSKPQHTHSVVNFHHLQCSRDAIHGEAAEKGTARFCHVDLSLVSEQSSHEAISRIVLSDWTITVPSLSTEGREQVSLTVYMFPTYTGQVLSIYNWGQHWSLEG